MAVVVSRLAFLLVVLPLMATAQESCVISGRVVDDTGRPVPFAVVQVLRERFLRDEFVVAGSAVNKRGEYCVRDLAAGDYLVRATARVHPPSASPRCDSCCDPSTELETTPYRSLRVAGSASPVSVGKSRNRSGVEIRMRRVPAYCVRGEVRDSMGYLASRAFITFDGGNGGGGVISEGGRFLLTHLPSGSYTILIRDQPQGFGNVLARQTVKVSAANIDGLVINIGSSSPVR